MINWFKYLWCKYNPFDIGVYILKAQHNLREMQIEMKVPLAEIQADLQEIRHHNNVTIALLENELAEKEYILEQFVDKLPDMVWMKQYDDNGVGGKYVYANKAIRDQLLLCPNPIGSTDIELATRAKEVYGIHNHTFGEKCANSDIITIENDKNGIEKSKFMESGLVKGKMMYLEVHKAVLRAKDGRILGVFGSGRILTEYMEAVNELEQYICNMSECETINHVVSTFKKYQFGEE